MHTDARGLALTTDSAEAASHYNDAIDAYFQYRLSTSKLLKQALEADGEFVMGHVLKGYLFMLFGSESFYPKSRAALAAAEANAGHASAREQRHVAALDRWSTGDMSGAISVWGALLDEDPLDLLALRLHHFNTFWMGRNYVLRNTVAGAFDAWSESMPGYGNVLGMMSFGLEECGEYARAEALGRRAVELDPEDLWAIHAVAHVLEMQGRLDDGASWLDYPADRWDDRNPFRGHLWWHSALFPLELGQYDKVLDIYDRSIRSVQSEFYLDIQNMASLLMRLELMGVDVGDRWEELADHADGHVDDHALAFTDVHCAMSIAMQKRTATAGKLLASLRSYADKPNNYAAQTMLRLTVPLCEAIFSFGEGHYADCVERLAPIRDDLSPLGGSHAQRDVFTQMLLEAAIRCGRFALARTLLRERIALRPTSFNDWQRYANVLSELQDDAGAERARREAQAIAAAA